MRTNELGMKVMRRLMRKRSVTLSKWQAFCLLNQLRMQGAHRVTVDGRYRWVHQWPHRTKTYFAQFVPMNGCVDVMVL